MDRRPPTPPDAPDFKAQADIEAFSNYLSALVDLATPQEVTDANASAVRVAENIRALREGLPVGPSGEIGGIRMGELEILAEEDPRRLTPQQLADRNASHEIVRETEDRLRRDLRSTRSSPPWRASW